MVGQTDIEFPPQRLRLIRGLLRKSQAEFAESYGIDIKTVSRIENGRTEAITGKVLGALLKAAEDAGA